MPHKNFRFLVKGRGKGEEGKKNKTSAPDEKNPGITYFRTKKINMLKKLRFP